MRKYLFLIGVSLLGASPVTLSAQEASPAPQTPNAAAAAGPAQPASVTSATPASPVTPDLARNSHRIACEYTTHEGMLVSLNHCVSQSEAARIRRDQQQTFRESQMNSLTYRGPRP
jgi:hypothetical protein